MPLYTIACRNSLPKEIRKAVSATITNTHCEVTDAPPEFVNVIFMNGYPLKNSWDIGVIGGVRSGGNRNIELIEKLRRTLHTNICAASDLPAEKVGVDLIGIKANWVMEGGRILPEPGAEDDWLNKSS